LAMRTLFFAGLLLLVFAAMAAAAIVEASGAFPSTACTNAADPDVWLVRTGGFWMQAKRYGQFRVVVLRRGIEHSTEWAQLQILESDDQAQKRRATRCVDLQTPGLKGYVRDVTFTKATGKLTAVSVRVEMKGMGELVLDDVFLVSGEGKISKLVEAKATDLGD
jgi:hypothetical protein